MFPRYLNKYIPSICKNNTDYLPDADIFADIFVYIYIVSCDFDSVRLCMISAVVEVPCAL